MKRSMLTAVAAAVLSAAVAVAGFAPAAAAAPSGKGRAVAAEKAQSKVQKRVAVLQHRAVLQVRHKDASLARVLNGRPLGALDAAVAGAVAGNIGVDRAVLAELEAAATSVTTLAEVRAVITGVRAVRPNVYVVAVHGLLQADGFETQVSDNGVTTANLATEADLKEAEGWTVTEVRALLDAASTANGQASVAVAAAVEKGLTLSATSSRPDLRAFRADLGVAGELLAVVEEQIALAEAGLEAMVPPSEESAAQG